MRYTLFVTDYPVFYPSPKEKIGFIGDVVWAEYPDLKLYYLEEYTADGRYVGVFVSRLEDTEALEVLFQWPVIPVATGNRRKIEKAWSQLLLNNMHLRRFS